MQYRYNIVASSTGVSQAQFDINKAASRSLRVTLYYTPVVLNQTSLAIQASNINGAAFGHNHVPDIFLTLVMRIPYIYGNYETSLWSQMPRRQVGAKPYVAIKVFHVQCGIFSLKIS